MQRYRQVTISLSYVGDSVLNSLSDILMMSAGFLFAAKARVWVTWGCLRPWRRVARCGSGTT